MLPTRQMYHNYTYMRANMLKIDVCYILTDFLGSYSRKIDLWLILLKKNSSSGFCTLQSNRAVSAEGTASSRPHRGSKRNIKKAWAENYQDLLHERSIAGGAYMLSDARNHSVQSWTCRFKYLPYTCISDRFECFTEMLPVACLLVLNDTCNITGIRFELLF